MSAAPEQVQALLHDLLDLCVRTDASDVHLAAGLPAYLRIHGILEPQVERGAMAAETVEALAQLISAPYDAEPLRRTGSLDGALTAPDGTRFRFNVFRRQSTYAIALRRLEDCFRPLAELGLPESLYQLCDMPDGLVLVCGPTGAGKSTTLATLIHRINETRAGHIVTIEDPIEYLHKPLKSLVNQRQVGIDTASFNHALVASLRQDPDVILVGEIRELNTIRTAITASETGHLVFSTVHAGDTVGTVERLVSVFPADEQAGVRRQLSMVLRAIIAQHLVVADGPAATTGKGKRRRVVASEILLNTPAVANLIATGKSNQIYSALETGATQGMQTLEHDLARLWMQNHITEQTATTMARNPALVRDRLQFLRKGPSRPGVPR
jgi:twitching motility protein PilT